MMEQGRLDPVPKLSARAMVRAMIKKACDGDVQAFNAVADRSDGKPKMIVGGDSEAPIELIVTRGDEARSKIAEQLERIAQRQVDLLL